MEQSDKVSYTYFPKVHGTETPSRAKTDQKSERDQLEIEARQMAGRENEKARNGSFISCPKIEEK